MPLREPDRNNFVRMLSVVAALNRIDMTPDLIALYWNALLEFDLAAVRQALDRHVKNPDTGQFMPKPADIVRMLQGTTIDASLVAWTKVESAVRRVGSYADVVFDDPVIHRVLLDMGGWISLCATLSDEMPFRAKEFQTRYRGYAMRREIPDYPSRLIGRESSENGRMGFALSPPVFIGDTDAAQRVMALGQGFTGPKISNQPTPAPVIPAIERAISVADS